MPALCRGSTQDRRKERRGGGRLIIIMGGRSSNVGSNGQSYNSHQYLQWPARQPLLSPIYDSFAAIMSKFLRSRSSAVRKILTNSYQGNSNENSIHCTKWLICMTRVLSLWLSWSWVTADVTHHLSISQLWRPRDRERPGLEKKGPDDQIVS